MKISYPNKNVLSKIGNGRKELEKILRRLEFELGDNITIEDVYIEGNKDVLLVKNKGEVVLTKVLLEYDNQEEKYHITISNETDSYLFENKYTVSENKYLLDSYNCYIKNQDIAISYKEKNKMEALYIIHYHEKEDTKVFSFISTCDFFEIINIINDLDENFEINLDTIMNLIKRISQKNSSSYMGENEELKTQEVQKVKKLV